MFRWCAGHVGQGRAEAPDHKAADMGLGPAGARHASGRALLAVRDYRTGWRM